MNRILTLVTGAALLLAGAGCGAGSSTTTVAAPGSATSVGGVRLPARGECTPAPKYGGCRYERPTQQQAPRQARQDPLCLVSATVIEARIAAGDTLPDCIRAKQAGGPGHRP